MPTFEFGNSGIIGTDKLSRTLPNAVKMTGSLANSLSAASKHYALIMPYLVPRLVPNLPFEPLAEACKETGYPTEHRFWTLPETMFELDDIAKQMGLVGNVLHGVPLTEWPTVHNFIKSIAICDSRNGFSATFAIQKLTVVDPFMSSLVSELATATVYTITVARPAGVVCWVPSRSLVGVARTFMPLFTKSIHAESVGTLTDALLDGHSDPLSKVEEVHGLREIRLPAKLDDKGVDGL